jgi:hypothetical protein
VAAAAAAAETQSTFKQIINMQSRKQ